VTTINNTPPACLLVRRRAFLARAGAMAVSGGAGGLLRAYAESVPEIDEGAQYEPWRSWRRDPHDPHEGALAFVRAAVLAPSIFNTQPWLFKVTRARIEVYADLKRNLGAFDVYEREMHLSLGCALQNILLAGAANGFRSSLALAPGKLEPRPDAKLEPVLVARIDLAPARSLISELYDAIPRRHTSRDSFDARRELPSGFIEALMRLTQGEQDVRLFLFTETIERRKLATWMQEAAAVNLADSAMQRGLQPWIRHTGDDLRQSRDGERASAEVGGALSAETERALLLSGRLFGMIALHDRVDREQTLRAGGLWQRCHLLATAWGLAARPYNSIILAIDQERRGRRAPRYGNQLSEMTRVAAWQPTLMFYMGYPTVPPRASPRRPATDVELP